MIQVLNYNKFMWSVFGKWGRKLLQSEADFLIAKSGNFHYKVKQLFYYNVGQILLQKAANIAKWGKFITRCGNYYKVRHNK